MSVDNVFEYWTENFVELFFFFQYDNLFSEAQCICMSHFFYTNWNDLPIMTIHVHVKYDDIIT